MVGPVVDCSRWGTMSRDFRKIDYHNLATNSIKSRRVAQVSTLPRPAFRGAGPVWRARWMLQVPTRKEPSELLPVHSRSARRNSVGCRCQTPTARH